MAGRIPQSFINELLARVDLVEVIERRVPLKKSGRNYSACCPFHNEKTPSFSVNPDKQFYYCFGCGVSGNALTFIMEYEGQEFVAAIEDLAQQQGMEVPREAHSAGESYNQHQHLYELMELVSQTYQKLLKSHPQANKAVNYLKNRGLSGQIAKQYGIGFVPDEWQNLLHLKPEQKPLIEDLEKAGMMIKKDNGHAYDRFRDRIMFPIRNRRGQVLGFGGRVIDKGEPKYLNSPETPLFHKSKELYGLYEMRKQLRSIEQIIIVEGYMDVVALAQFGIPNSVATLGTATTSDHLQMLFRICPKLVFCFDGDKAGKKAALRALSHSLPQLKETREIRLMFLADGEDPDSTVRKIGKDAFLEQMSNASTLFDYLIEHLTSQVDMNTFEGPASLVHLAKPFVVEISEPVLRARFEQKIGQLSGLGNAQIAQVFEQDKAKSTSTLPEYKTPNITQSHNITHSTNTNAQLTQRSNNSSQTHANRQANSTQQPQTNRNKAIFKRAIALLLQYPSALPATDFSWLDQVSDKAAKTLLEIIRLINHQQTITTAILIEQWRDKPEHKRLTELANENLHTQNDIAHLELGDIFKRLEKNCILDKVDQLKEKVRDRTATPNEKKELQVLLSKT